MKFVLLCLVALVASTTAWPEAEVSVVEQKSQRFIDDLLLILIDVLIELIKELNLDPYYLERGQWHYTLPDADFFEASAAVESVALNGLSNIVVNHISYNLFTGVLLIDLRFPQVAGSVAAASGKVRVFTRTLTGEGSGSLALNNVRFNGRASVTIDAVGINVDNINIQITMGSVDSNIDLNLFGYDLSDPVNNLLGNTIPSALEKYKEPLGGLFGYIAQRLVDRFL